MNIDTALKALKEELLLEGKSWENFYDSLPNDVKDRLTKQSKQTDLEELEIVKILRYYDPTATESNAGKYSMWLVKKQFGKRFPKALIMNYENDELRKNNALYNNLKHFNRIGNNLKRKDINQYDKIRDLRDTLEEYENERSTKKLKGKVDFKSEKWSVKKVDSAKESCELGKGTKWCITNNETFDEYNERNNIFFLTDGNKKYALTVARGRGLETAIVYNEQDNKVGGKDFLTNNLPKEIIDYIKKETNINEEFVDIVKTAFDEDEQYSIYKNPNSREIKDILKEQDGKDLRIIADTDNKNMYIFSANLLHYKASQELYNKLGSNKYGDNNIFLEGSYKSGKIKINKVPLNKKLVSKNKEWLEKYLIFKDSIKEEFSDLVKEKDDSYSIYKNPNSREIKDVLKEQGDNEVRFIVDFDNEDFYLFPANLLHHKASKALGISYASSLASKLFASGVYIPKDKKIYSQQVKTINKVFKDGKMDFAEKYLIL